MKQAAKREIDPEDNSARLAAEATNDATPDKSLYSSADRRKPNRSRPKGRRVK
jgi:hypothetical protein